MTNRISEDNQARHQRRWQAIQSILPHNYLLEMKALQVKQSSCNARSSNSAGRIDAKRGQYNQAELQIILQGKMSVAVGDNFSPATLSRLLTVLESR